MEDDGSVYLKDVISIAKKRFGFSVTKNPNGDWVFKRGDLEVVQKHCDKLSSDELWRLARFLGIREEALREKPPTSTEKAENLLDDD